MSESYTRCINSPSHRTTTPPFHHPTIPPLHHRRVRLFMSFSKDIGRLRAYKGLIAHLSPGLQAETAAYSNDWFTKVRFNSPCVAHPTAPPRCHATTPLRHHPITPSPYHPITTSHLNPPHSTASCM